jgi:hypothetical protein
VRQLGCRYLKRIKLSLDVSGEGSGTDQTVSGPLATGNFPRNIIHADINADGKPDLMMSVSQQYYKIPLIHGHKKRQLTLAVSPF